MNKHYITFLLLCLLCLSCSKKQTKDFNRSEIFFSYTSACNIAFEIKDNLVNIIFDECCGNPIDSLLLIRSEQYPRMYDIVDKNGNFYYTISKSEPEYSKGSVDMINNGIKGESFVRYDDNAQPIGEYSDIVTCEQFSKTIEFWNFLDNDRLDDFKNYLISDIPTYSPDPFLIKRVKPYVDKMKLLSLLYRSKDASIIYQVLKDKLWTDEILISLYDLDTPEN